MKANTQRRTAIATGVALLGLAVLGSCTARAPAPGPAPSPIRPAVRPSPLPAPPPVNWIDAPATPGTWRWGLAGGRSTASYGEPGQAPLLSLACDRDSASVVLTRASNNPGQQPMAVYTTSGTRRFVGVEQQGGTGFSLSIRDDMLEAMAFSRGRFAVDLAGQPTLYLPSWPELSRVIEDCR